MDILADFAQWAFFALIFEFLNTQIASFQTGLIARGTQFVSGLALTLCTLWVLMQGFMIVTGRSRESMMGLVVGSLRVFLIVSAATAMSFAGTNLTSFLADGLPRSINTIVTGTDEKPEKSIDKNLKIMGLIFVLVDRIGSGNDDAETKASQDRTITLMGIGIAGPSVVGGAMLLLYKIALVLFVGFGPLFILCLMFDQTKELFKRWLLYGIGTMFSLAVLSFMVSVSTKLVAITAAALLLQYTLLTQETLDLPGVMPSGGLNAAAMQQGGIGLLMSVLMVMAPPMAAMFFSGTLGQFAASSSFGTLGRNSSGQTADTTMPTQKVGARRKDDEDEHHIHDGPR
ncbi:type IV secretion system protein [Luteimonas sp. 3794]|uniref:type IV secretion system protein n=1 Tax=Luteimonas sp. 3794 TaxID=2817730 RepID=UPI0028665B4F|nr:type IV secretion system protein [Luteimonas sp. 3794]MDR6991637.1 type IV secretion system protein VirB6 [Luteimonas sp. 3794]